MEFVIKISQFLLSLSLLIVLHELGHFIPAKLFGTRVEKFYLFFDVKFSLFKKKIGDTVYGIGWLPLGGYVKIAGMIDESMDKEQMAQEPQPWEFRSKPAWQRLIIMLGGVTVNFILAYFIYVGLAFAYGDKTTSLASLKDGYWIENQLLQDIGFKTGDKILKVNDMEVVNDYDVRSNIIGAENFTIDRDGETKVIALPEDFLGQFTSADSRQLFERRIPFMVGEIADSSFNKSSDLKVEDIITSIEGQELKYFDQLNSIMANYKNKTVQVGVLRGNDEFTATLKVDENGKFGIFPGMDRDRFAELGYFDITLQTYTFGESFAEGGRDFVETMQKYGAQLKAIFNPSTGAYKGVGGFKAIFDIFPPFWSWQAFWVLTAFLSVMLGVLNLLPIPALDGGHVMFLLYEMVSGRAPSEKFLERAQLVGFIILIVMVLSANINDWI
ncbi:RIP metalloprotease RseP [Subsaximicrobium wynnwilliamsii]|uniref:Zinc metalloprotease n=1 Tax=Subsaximicrobium wynnwilliamsii TaxID=291179 RepID=A0A5C6ZI70_9FLAO|nr:RIP metalloprotease RseP [Subsaximicrobium wynnwilliamsii]TXD83859.1 RIP metalloprotease RseP [Subsaximicrobium wynnwilliamsii]TXD89600.1 RIP metalloprotease RseP [Subsaximicrobium wynnwilliamsii]TXE02609.1 RIP metalloprotease RseP [Subsaximicrobium wynnwilliamsii]